MKSISYYRGLLLEEKELSKKQMDIADEAEPFDKITGADFKALRDKKNMKEDESNHTKDHEVSMAQNSLKSIISSASQLINLIGDDEKDIPAWIQDHITNAENYINQASKNYHEYSNDEYSDEDQEDIETNMSLQDIMEDLFEAKKKPSKGLSKKKKSAIVKQAKKGKDFGKKGPGFEKIVKAAEKSGAKNPEAVAGAAFWKGQAKKAK